MNEKNLEVYELLKKRDLAIKEYNKINDEIIQKTRKERRKYKMPANTKYVTYLKRANAKKIDFTLTVEHFDELGSCECRYCGDHAVCFDRVDSKLGYTPNNVVPSCNTCNIMKYTMSITQFHKHIDKLYKKFNSETQAE